MKDISLFNDIINDFINRKYYLGANFSAINTEICNYYLNTKLSVDSQFLNRANSLVGDFQKIHEESVLINEKTSCDFNVLDLFDIGETQHSYLIAYFLNPTAGHGQKHLFLNSFLDLLQIKRLNDNENWVVTAEKGRIDILLKRVSPHSVVVIENKSNYAVDQNHQLYRYWYQEIYKTICKNGSNISDDYILNPPDHLYQLIYLSPSHGKLPNSNTLIRPSDWSNELPIKVPMEVKHLFFSEFICQWLKNSLDLLPANNHRIREYVKQYIEYWT